MILDVPKQVQDLRSFAELLSWAMQVWGHAEGGLLGIIKRTATNAASEVTLEKNGDRIELEFGALPSTTHAQWFLRVGLLVARGELKDVDPNGLKLPTHTRMRGYKSADSAKDWYWGTTCGEEYFGYFAEAVGLPMEVQVYLRDRYSSFEFRRRPKRFARIEFNQARVIDAINSSDALLREHPWVDRLGWRLTGLRSATRSGIEPMPTSAFARPSTNSDPDAKEHTVPASFKSEWSGNDVGIDVWRLGGEFIIDSVIVDAAICDYEGVDLGSVVVRGVGSLVEIEAHPVFIEEAKVLLPKPEPNRPKAHLVDWQAPIIDQGNILTLEVAKSDYWTSQATQRSVARVQRMIASGEMELMALPRRLDVHLVVVCCGDNKLLLARRGSHVATEPSTWMVTVGESVDWDRDRRGDDDLPHPERTARKCLAERDELNLPMEFAQAAKLRLIAIATEWSEMLVNLIVVARVPHLTFDVAKHHFRRGENVRLDAVEFTAEACATLLESRYFAGSSGQVAAQPVSDISRAALLATVRHAFPGSL